MSDAGASVKTAGEEKFADLNVLLALEDDERWIRMYSAMAHRAGYHYVGVKDLDSFIQAYLRERPSIIVMDLILGEADCSAALDFLVRCRCPLPVVLATGFNQAYIGVVEDRYKGTLKFAGRIEKKRNAYQLEDLLRERKVPSAQELMRL